MTGEKKCCQAYLEKLAFEPPPLATGAANTSATLEDFLKDELDEAEAILANVVSEATEEKDGRASQSVATEERREEEKRGAEAAQEDVLARVEEVDRRHYNKSKWAFAGDASKKQLTTQKGEEIEILRCYMQLGWSFARRVRDSEKGFVPNNYLESVPDESLAQLKWQVGDGCLAQAVSGDWRRGRVMDVGEKTCRVRFDDGSEKIVGSLGITPDSRDDELPAPLMLPKPTGSLKKADATKILAEKRAAAVAKQQTAEQPVAAPAAVAASPATSRASSGGGTSSAEAMWEALQSKVKSPPPKEEPKAAEPKALEPKAQEKDPNKLWQMLQQKVMSPKQPVSPAASPAPPAAVATPPPTRFQLGDAVWVCNLEDKWVRGEIVGTTGDMWEVVIESTGEMLLRTDNLVRPAKQQQAATVIVQQVLKPQRTSSSSNVSMGEDEYDDQMFAPAPAAFLTPTLNRRNSVSAAAPLMTLSGAPARGSIGGDKTSGVASWSAANAPRRLSQGVVNANDLLVGSAPSSANNSGRIQSDAPVPIFTLDGGKRTMMLTPKLGARDIVVEILQRWKMEQHASDCVLVSVVRDEMVIVKDALPLTVKSKWPLIVNSNKNELPKCRFVVRCKEGASPKLREFLGDPLPGVNAMKTV